MLPLGSMLPILEFDLVDAVAGSNEESARCEYAKYASIFLHISNSESEWQQGNSPPMLQ